MIRILELFGGIGACSKAFERLGIEHEIVDYVEIDKYAVKSFNAIHNTNFEPQDITQWDKDIEVDLIMHGSPCQSFSLAGKGEGGDIGSGTKSSLMWETIRIVDKLKPKYVIWENVKGVLQKAQIHNFEKYLSKMEEIGYTNYYKILNSKHFGVAQDRERMFVVSIRNDINIKFEFPKEYDHEVKLKDVLDKDVDERFLVTKVLNARRTKKYIQYDNSGKEYNSQAQRLYYLEGQMCTLPKCNSGDKTQVLLDEENMIGRRITPCEAWRLMGFSTDDFLKAQESGQTLGSLYAQAGNSIALPVIKSIFENLLL